VAGSGCKDPQTVSETVAEATGQAGGAEGSERRLGVLPCCRAGWVEGRATYLMPILRQNSGRSRAPPLVLRAGHVHEAVAADEHVARVDRLSKAGRRRGRLRRLLHRPAATALLPTLL